jgi:AraC-like DNA-binding protein
MSHGVDRSSGMSFVSIEDLLRNAESCALGLMPAHTPASNVQLVEATTQRLQAFRQLGSQDILALGEDLLLIRTDFHGIPLCTIGMDVRSWLYLHFRLDGLSDEEFPGGVHRRLDRECFFLSATSRPRPLARELLADSWHTVGILFRPSFAERELRFLGDSLPAELRNFRSGDEVDFTYVGGLTSDMRAAVLSLLHTSMPVEIRNIYLRAKIIELICLALARVCARNEASADLSVRLSRRDIECVQKARALVLANSPAPSLASLARQVGINRNKLAVGFKHVFGVTVGELDREARLSRARTLLERDRLPVRVVATLVGYADPGSFSKAFKILYGVLPSELHNTDLASK